MIISAIASDRANSLRLSGQLISARLLVEAAVDGHSLSLTEDPVVLRRMRLATEQVDQAVASEQKIYGVTTGFGGMAGESVPCEQAMASQRNLLFFLASGLGEPIDPVHTRAAMILRANVLMQGCSGARYSLVQRLTDLINADAIPVVRELGSIGASGDLIPLATIARAMIGENANVHYQGSIQPAGSVLEQLDLEPIELRPKEGLALVNGTSFSSAIAANAVVESQRLLGLTMAVQGMMLQSLLALQEPFDDFVHQKKPHPGQVWVAKTMKKLLRDRTRFAGGNSGPVQDRYSLRCLAQYLGPAVEGIMRIRGVVETEMNSVSDNPLIDTDTATFHQSGNFLGQYIAVAMDELRRHLGLMAKHLDVQLATLVTPAFNRGLPASLRGNAERPYNMGLKGLQIAANSIMPMLVWQGNSLTEHFPTHAEQFNQNINGLSWGSANLAWKSVQLYQQYIATSLIASVQACDLRAQVGLGHCDGRALLGTRQVGLYESICGVLDATPGSERPLLHDDPDRWLEQDLTALVEDLQNGHEILGAISDIEHSLEREFGGGA